MNMEVNVKDFGAIGDGVTDDTLAIQAVIDANPERAIFFPAGTYKITNTLKITSAGTRIVGEMSGGGAGAAVGSAIVNYGPCDAVYFLNMGADGTTLHGCGIEKMAITRANHMATGAGLHLRDTSTFSLNEVHIAEHVVCYDLEGAQSSKFTNFSAYTGNCFTGVTGSSLLRIRPLSTYVGNAVDAGWVNIFDQFILTSNNITEYTIDIAGGDTMLFSNGYCGDANIEHVRIKGAPATPMYTILFDNVYFDGVRLDDTGTPIGVRHETDGDASTGSADIRFTGCTFGQLDTSIYIEEPGCTSVIINGCEFHNNRDDAIFVSSVATRVSINGCIFSSVGTNIGNSGAITIDHAASVVISGNNFVWLDSGTNKAIKLVGAIGLVSITGNAFDTCDSDLTNNATITKFIVSGNSSNNSINTIMGVKCGNINNGSPTTLDWYLEGNWTPDLKFGGANTGISYANRCGRYTRIGNRVFFECYIQLADKGYASGACTVSGLPYPVDVNAPAVLTVLAGAMSTDFGDVSIMGHLSAGSEFQLDKFNSGNVIQWTNMDFQNISYLIVSGCYKV